MRDFYDQFIKSNKDTNRELNSVKNKQEQDNLLVVEKLEEHTKNLANIEFEMEKEFKTIKDTEADDFEKLNTSL